MNPVFKCFIAVEIVSSYVVNTEAMGLCGFQRKFHDKIRKASDCNCTTFSPAITCFSGDLPEVTNGTFNCTADSEISKDGSCNITCEDGFYPAVSKQAVCVTGADSQKGVWSEGNFTCRALSPAITCSSSDLPEVTNGTFNCTAKSEIPEDGSCNLTCDDGFYPAVSKQAVCETAADSQEGVWSEGNFTCREIKCFNSDLHKVTSGSFICPSKNVTRNNGVCNLTCDNDLYPSPFNRTVCGAGNGENGGEWYPKNLSCRQIECTDWNEWSGNVYKLMSSQQSWDKSLQTCTDNSAHLVTIESKEEDQFVQKLVKNCNTRPTWIGLRFNETDGTWEWSDGTDAVFRNWGGSKPPSGGQGYCVYIDINTKRWFELRCNSFRQVVCRRKP